MRMSGLPLYRRALKQPENVKRVLEMREQGVARTSSASAGSSRRGLPTGYSADGRGRCGRRDVEGFRAGDRVACAGAGIANHAEFIDVPVNLAVRVPDGLDSGAASTVTLGAIALQGVRRAQPTLGETVASSDSASSGNSRSRCCTRTDVASSASDVDPTRIEQALAHGMAHGIGARRTSRSVHGLTDGFGADAVIDHGSYRQPRSRSARQCRPAARRAASYSSATSA